MPKEKRWVGAGWIKRSTDCSNAVIRVFREGGESEFYVADLPEVLQVLTGKRVWTKILKMKGK